jgi:pimeloyl-ACP methyl ester carboxylesterase
MQVVVDGLLTNYELSGSGKLVVMIHGWGSDIKSFGSLQRDLSKSYQTLSLDLPGMGDTSQPEDNWNLDDFASFVSNIISKLNLKNPYAIIGHSNGGAIAVKIVSKKLAKPQKLILLASSGVRDKQTAKKKVLATLAKTGKKSLLFLPKGSQDRVKNRLYSSIGSEGLLIPGLEQTFRNIVNEDIQDIARSIKVPTLLIYGESDTSTPPEYGEALASSIEKSKLKIIDGAGHFVQLDQPSRVISLVRRFLK